MLNVNSRGGPKDAGGVRAAIWVRLGMILCMKSEGRRVDVCPFVVRMSFGVEIVPRGVWTVQVVVLVLEELVENQRRLVEETTGLIHSLHEGMASTNRAIRFLLKRETERNEVTGPSSAEGEGSKMSDKAKGKRREK